MLERWHALTACDPRYTKSKGCKHEDVGLLDKNKRGQDENDGGQDDPRPDENDN